MGISINFKNLRNYKGEKVADLLVKSSNSVKPINCPTKFNSAAIDEFLLIFFSGCKSKWNINF